MAIPSRTIERLRKALIDVMSHADKSVLVLFHVNISTRRQSIWSDRTWSDPEETAQTVWEQASQYTDNMGGQQRFALMAYEDNDTGKEFPISTTMFIVDTSLGGGFGEEHSSEPPTDQGLLSQLMRHNEAMFRTSNAATGALTHHLAKMVEKLSDENETLRHERIRTITVMENLHTQAHERDLATQAAKAEQERKDALFGKMMEIGPLLLNKVTGQEMVRAVKSPLEATVSSFMESITPNQLDQISNSGIFRPDQKVLFATILEQLTKMMITLEDKKKAAATAKAAAEGTL